MLYFAIKEITSGLLHYKLRYGKKIKQVTVGQSLEGRLTQTGIHIFQNQYISTCISSGYKRELHI